MSDEGAADVALNAIGVLTRREIEARILAPIVEALGREFDRARVLEIVRDVIVARAREQGEALAGVMGANGLDAFFASLEAWTRGGALELEVLEHTDDRLSFDVHRCRYAELYRSLGIPELGAVLSCNRDAALIEGFNGEIRFERTQTIMAGASCCDFRYERRRP